jgi:hypothetical protein
MKEKSKENLETMIKTDETKIIARDDEVKAIKTNAEEFRARKDKQIDERIETEALITLPSPFATTFNIFILTFTILIFSSNIFNFNPFVSTHHVQTFTIGDFSDYKVLHLSRLINSAHTKATTKALANTDSIRLFKIPEKPPDPRTRNLHRNLLVPRYLLSGQIRKSENDLYHNSFIINYLDSSR